MEKVPVREDNSEIVHYNSSDIKLMVVERRLSQYYDMRANCHWHDEIEIIIALDNEMRYYVNGKVFHIKRENGIFINGGRLHYGLPFQNMDCRYMVVLFDPMLVCGNTNIQNKYVHPFLFEKNLDEIELIREKEWTGAVLDCVTQIYDFSGKSGFGYELDIQSKLYELWSLLVRFGLKQDKSEKEITGISILKKMLIFIQNNYMEEICLSDIAAAGNICRSSCCQIFRENLHQSPKEYLQNYRISKSLELLNEKELSITEVAYACGFHSLSYFTETFHKWRNTTPKEYRKNYVKG